MSIGEIIVALFAILMICVTVIIIFAPRENFKEALKDEKKKK